MKHSIKSSILILLVSLVAHAGNDHGGGGVIACAPQDKELVLDVFEGRILYPNETIDLGPSRDPVEMALTAIERLRRLDPVKAERYEKEVRRFFEEARFITSSFMPSKDIGYTTQGFSRIACRFKQIIWQIRGSSPRYLIHRTSWSALSSLDRALLILHEINVGESRRLGHPWTVNARKFTYLLASRKFESMAQEDYDRLIFSLGLANNQPLRSIAPMWNSLAVKNIKVPQFMGPCFPFEDHAVSVTRMPLTFRILGNTEGFHFAENGSLCLSYERPLGIYPLTIEATDNRGNSTTERILLRVQIEDAAMAIPIPRALN